jgi:cell wall-associated NlpC family hydrolase
MMAYRAAGIAIRRTSQEQWAAGRRIPAAQARPGDLVFFAGSDGTITAPGHVGIITSHDTMIDAPMSGEVVHEESFTGSTDLVGFTRP